MNYKHLLASAAFCLTATLTGFAKDRALLIGVDEYKFLPPDKQLVGCVEDALEMKKFIKSRLSFSEDSIIVLLNQQATVAAIQQAMAKIIADTQPGDRVFLLYSGHGSRAKDDNSDEGDGYDETIAPHDAIASLAGTGQIRDDEFGRWIEQLPGRRIVMLFDSCYSGTISRAAFEKNGHTKGIRYLPPVEEESQGRGKDFLNLDGEMDADKRPQKLRQADVVVMSAASNVQTAQLVNWKGARRGALALSFTETQRNGLLSVRDLQNAITQQIQTWQRAQLLPGAQTPQFEVGLVSQQTQTLFGRLEPSYTTTPQATFLYNEKSKRTIHLQTPGDRRVYYDGDLISYQITTNQPGYLYLIVFSAGDRASLLFPNHLDKGNKIEAGTTRFPRGRDEFPVDATGVDTAVALVTSYPIEGWDFNRVDYSWAEMFERLQIKKLQAAIEAGAKSRGQGVRPAEIDWQATSIAIDTRKK